MQTKQVISEAKSNTNEILYYNPLRPPRPTAQNLGVATPLTSRIDAPALMFCNRSFSYTAPALWNGLQKDLRQFAHPPNPSRHFTYSPLALSFATFHSRLKTELFKI